MADSTPDLALGLSSGSEPVEPGGLVTYELVYAHRGSTAALDALLRMPVPVGTTFVSASGGGALVGNTVEWSLGAFAVQAAGQQTLTVQVTAASGEVIDATAEIFDQLSAAKPARASSVAAVRSARPLTLSISASPDPVRPGEEVVYALTVTNASGVAQTGLVLDATTPTDMTVSSGDLTDGGVCPGSSCSPGEVAQWSLGTLADGASRTVALSAHLDSISPLPDGTILSLAATVHDDTNDAASARADVRVDSNAPDLLLGQVTSDGSGLSSVTVTADCGLVIVGNSTDAGGLFALSGLPNGQCTVTPSRSGYEFDPAARVETIAGASITGADFRACPANATLSGVVRNAATGEPLSGVAVDIDSGAFTDTTNGSGAWSIAGVGCGDHIVSVMVSGLEDFLYTISTFDVLNLDVALTTRDTVYGLDTSSGMSPDPVNTATGNYVYQHRDLEVTAPGMPFVFERTYNSQAGAEGIDGPLGFGWSWNWQISVDPDIATGNVSIHWGDGRILTWTPDGSGGFNPQYGEFDTLVDDGDGTYSLHRRDQVVYDFDALDRLVAITDRNGNATTLTYISSDLSQITDSAGRIYTFTTDASGRITQIADPISRTVQFGYDANGDLTSATDPRGNAEQFTYDTDHQLLTLTDRRENLVVENEYDAQNRTTVSVQRDAFNTRTTYTYDALDRRTTLTLDADGLAISTVHQHDSVLRLVRDENGLSDPMQFAYDDAGNRKSVTDRNGNQTTYKYDARGNVTKKTQSLNAATSFDTTLTYDADNNPLTRADALGHTTQFEYDASGNLTKMTDPLSGETIVTYDARGLPLTIEDPEQNVSTYQYDTAGNRAKIIDPFTKETVFTYDGAGRRLTRTDPLLRLTQWAYDANDNVLSLTDPDSETTAFTYDGNDNRITATDALTHVTQSVYDARDRLTQVVDPALETTTYAYDTLDRRVSVTDRRSKTTTFGYDAAGNLTSRTDPLNNTTTYAYDANGNRVSMTDPNSLTTQFSYDALDRLVETQNHLGQANSVEYDPVGRATSRTDAANRTTSFEYDALGRLTKVTDPLSAETTLGYDANGNRLTQVGPNGDLTSFEYDALSRLTKVTEHLGGATTYGYDDVGNRTSMTDALTQTTTYAYDALNRLEQAVHPGGPTVTYTYDAVGNRLSMVDGLGTTTYQYDALDRATQVTDSYGMVVGYGYDEEGNRTSITYPGSDTVTYGYDDLNRLETVTDWLAGVTTYTYDAAGRLTDAVLPNGTKVATDYDAANRLILLENRFPDDSILSSQSFGLDAVGNPTSETRTEPLGATRNGTSETYAYDLENRLLSRDDVVEGLSTYAHDANGNRTTDAEPGGTAVNNFDARDLLVSRTLGTNVTQHVYDGDGRRMARIENGSETRYVLDTAVPLFRVLRETDDLGNTLASYVYGLGLIARIDGTSRQVYHFDRNGSTLALTDSAAVVTDSYTYDPFGSVLAETGPTPNSFTFLGRHGVLEDEDPLFCVRARYYDSLTGRFLSKDPLRGSGESPQSLHRYAYSMDNPIRMIDVSGLNTQEGISAQESSSTSDVLHALFVGELSHINRTAHTTPLAGSKADLPVGFLEFLLPHLGQKSIVGIAHITGVNSELVQASNALGTAGYILEILGAFLAGFDAGSSYYDTVTSDPDLGVFDRISLGIATPVAAWVNARTAPGRSWGNYLVGDSDVRHGRVVGDLRLDRILSPVTPSDVARGVSGIFSP